MGESKTASGRRNIILFNDRRHVLPKRQQRLSVCLCSDLGQVWCSLSLIGRVEGTTESNVQVGQSPFLCSMGSAHATPTANHSPSKVPVQIKPWKRLMEKLCRESLHQGMAVMTLNSLLQRCGRLGCRLAEGVDDGHDLPSMRAVLSFQVDESVEVFGSDK